MSKPARGAKPRAGKAATERIELRVTRLERAAWEHAAAQAGLSLSEWIRSKCRPSLRVVSEDPLIIIRPGAVAYSDGIE